jgi:hypothetical protein
MIALLVPDSDQYAVSRSVRTFIFLTVAPFSFPTEHTAAAAKHQGFTVRIPREYDHFPYKTEHPSESPAAFAPEDDRRTAQICFTDVMAAFTHRRTQQRIPLLFIWAMS